MAAEMAPPSSEPLLVVISGPSGVGKDAVIYRLVARGLPCHVAVTMTTRPPRAGEVSGRDYVFVTDEYFNEMEDAGELLEWAEVYGHHYGVPRPPIREALAAGHDVVVRVDVQGAATIRRHVPAAVLIFLAPASLAELAERLRARGTESAAAFELRLHTAARELEQTSNFDYVVVNADGELERAVDQVEAIIVAEHCRVGRARPQV